MLQITLLGTFVVSVDGRVIAPSAWKRRKAAAIVKILALEPGQRLHREQMLDLLWPDADPDAAANRLHQALYSARRTLDPDGPADRFILSHDQMLQFNPAVPVVVDVVQFQELAARAGHERESIQAALDLYGGNLLPADLYEPWTAAWREMLREQHVTLRIRLAEVLQSGADLSGALDVWRRVLDDDPLNEASQRAVMRLHAQLGQRPQALRQFQAMADVLRDELGVDPEPASVQLYDQIVAGDVPAVHAAASIPAAGVAPLHNLPAEVSRFVGRSSEISRAREMLSSRRLLTFTGTGGTGKTRLALGVATQERARFPDGVWLVELAALADPTLLAQTIATELRVRDVPGQPIETTLVAQLTGRNMLLVLDNCEHLIAECARLTAELLRRCPNLQVLATSREPLQIRGEAILAVPALSLPEPGKNADVEAMMQSEAVQLFVDRAAAAVDGFTLRRSNAAAVATLCARLDGLPLAIELAAARLRVMTVDEMLERLDDRFRLLTSSDRSVADRQQTLQAMLDWSYQLLSLPEQVLLARVSIFAGGFDLQAARNVCAIDGIDPDDVAEGLQALVLRSLVTLADLDGLSRFTLLETIRAYGREQLQQRDEIELLRERHAAWFLELSEAASVELRGSDQDAWVTRLKANHDNLRAALTWFLLKGLSSDPDDGLRLAASLQWYWQLGGYVNEGRDWLGRFLALSAGMRTRSRAHALTGAGWLAIAHGEYGQSGELLSEAIDILRSTDDRSGLATALLWSTWTMLFQGRIEDANLHVTESMRMFAELSDDWGVGTCLLGRGFIDAEVGDLDSAEAVFSECLAVLSGRGDAWGMSLAEQQLAHINYRRGNFEEARERAGYVLQHASRSADTWRRLQAHALLGEIARASGDNEAAETSCNEALELARAAGHQSLLAWGLRDMGYIALSQGDLQRADASFRESLHIFRTLGYLLGVACCLAGFAAISAAQGQYRTAARLYGASDAELTRLHMVLAPADKRAMDDMLCALRSNLDEIELEIAIHEGRNLTPDDALQEAGL